MSFSESAKEAEAAKGYSLPSVRASTVVLPRLKSYLQCLRGIFSQRPLEVAYYWDGKMEELIREEVCGANYDLIFCHLIRMAPYVLNIRGIRKVLDLSDALSLRYSLSAKYRKGPFKFIEYQESARLKRYEPAVSAQFDLNFISSSKDKLYLQEQEGIPRLEVLESGITPEMLEEEGVRADFNKIVFFGNLRTFHNVDAIRYFYKIIFPLVKNKIRNARLVIVGANIPDCIFNLRRDSSVSVFRDVADIRPFIKDACVSVVPMRIAVGIQSKVLQSMASGLPVVTTTLGLGGIRAEDNKEILVADSPSEFAAKVAMLMQDHKLRSCLVRDAYALVKEHYLWQVICEDLNKKLVALF